jgi:uncharacterized protein YjbJ (UPF0337 family)
LTRFYESVQGLHLEERGIDPFTTIFFRGAMTMSGKSDELKGRVKEAAGAISDNDKLRREGKMDQAAGKVKEAAEKAIDKTKEALQGK